MSYSLELIKSAYLGGRNDCAFVGRSTAYPGTRDCIILDIDITSCYSNGMTTIPKLDISGSVDYIPLICQLDDAARVAMLESGVPADLIKPVDSALEKGQAAFDQLLSSSKRFRRFNERIRKACIVYDTRLLDRWVSLSPDDYVIPGFATVEFEFPETTIFPCLPMKHMEYGLIYPLKGVTTVPASEILLALQAGATIKPITSLELPVSFDESGQPRYLFRTFMKSKIQERERWKSEKSATGMIRQEILKNFLNGLYGKVAQAINIRNVYRPSKGATVPLQPSKVTDPCSAALTTGLIRSVLSAILLAIEQYNKNTAPEKQLIVISFTTDGLLFGIPTYPGYSVKEDYYDIKSGVPVLRMDRNLNVEVFLKDEKFGVGGLLDIMKEYLPIRQMQTARQFLSGTTDFLEIKHLLNNVTSIKTRGQFGFLEDKECLLLARFGHKPPVHSLMANAHDPDGREPKGYERVQLEAKWFLDHLEYVEGADEA